MKLLTSIKFMLLAKLSLVTSFSSWSICNKNSSTKYASKKWRLERQSMKNGGIDGAWGHKTCTPWTSADMILRSTGNPQETTQAEGIVRKENSSDECIRGQQLRLIDPNDYAIVDSIHLSASSRPSLSQVLNNSRDLVSIPVIALGVIVSTCNIFGWYNNVYTTIELAAVGLGITSSLAYTAQIVTGYGLSPNIRRGVVDDSAILLYAAAYTAASSWLALRAGVSCPSWLTLLDPIMGVAALFIFLFSLFAPIFTLLAGSESCSKVEESNSSGSGGDSAEVGFPTLWNRNIVQIARGFTKEGAPSEVILSSPPELSPTEKLRAQGLVAIGVVGCLFAPDALSFALGGQEWWGRVYDLHPSQRILESSTALFGMFATEASMLGHRLGKSGYMSFQNGCVPFGVTACMVLAVIPCISSLYWMGDDISFFSFYTD